VGDLILMRSRICFLIFELKKDLNQDFEIKDLGILHYFLGLKVYHMDDGIFLSQPNYSLYLLGQFQMSDCKHSPTPFQSRVKLTVACE
jgi:hypothetical protein